MFSFFPSRTCICRKQKPRNQNSAIPLKGLLARPKGLTNQKFAATNHTRHYETLSNPTQITIENKSNHPGSLPFSQQVAQSAAEESANPDGSRENQQPGVSKQMVWVEPPHKKKQMVCHPRRTSGINALYRFPAWAI